MKGGVLWGVLLPSLKVDFLNPPFLPTPTLLQWLEEVMLLRIPPGGK